MATDDNSNFQEDEVFVAILIDDEAVVELEDGGDVVVELRDSSVTTFAVDESLYPVVALISDSEESQYIIDEEDSAELLDLGSVVVDNFQERRQQKFIAQSRSKKQWIAITISISLLIVALAMLALESPIYDVDEVKLENDSTLALTEPEQAEILKSLETLKDQQMYRVNADGTIKKISAISTISEVKISKSWPGTLKAVIKRRVPIAFIETDKGIVLVDEQGFIFQKLEKPPLGLPSFDGLEEVTFSKKISDDTFLKILSDAPSEIRNQISNVRTGKDGFVAELVDGIDIILGDKTLLKEKLAISWSIILAKPRSDLGYIDVSVPTLPVSGSPQLKV